MKTTTKVCPECNLCEPGTPAHCDTQPDPPVRAMFRRDKRKPKGVFVLFPDVPGTLDPWTCLVFDPQGGHGNADLYGCVRMSVPADPATDPDAAKVRDILERRYGYSIAIVKRTPANSFEIRRNLTRRP